MSQITAYGVKYKLPMAHLLHATPLYVSEFAARTCYNSFDKSEHDTIKELDATLNCDGDTAQRVHDVCKKADFDVNSKGSELLHNLSHVYFHESTLEHVNLNFLIKNTSRGVLQELARHRIASFSVQSTRYTMSDLINWFNITQKFNLGVDFFINKIIELDIFITDDTEYNSLEVGGIHAKLLHQSIRIGNDKFLELTVAKSLLEGFKNSTDPEEAFTLLSTKAKKNVGDVFKGIVVTDTFSVDLGFSINLRSLKNFMDLRLSGAAYYQMQWLAYSIYKQIPDNYLKLIVKESKIKQFENLEKKILSGEWS